MRRDRCREGRADLGDGRAAGRLPGTMTACPGLVRTTRSGCPVPARAASPRPTTTAAGGCIADRPGPPRPSSSCGHGSAPTPSMTSRTCCEPGIPRPGPPPSGSTRPCAGSAWKSSTAPTGAVRRRGHRRVPRPLYRRQHAGRAPRAKPLRAPPQRVDLRRRHVSRRETYRQIRPARPARIDSTAAAAGRQRADDERAHRRLIKDGGGVRLDQARWAIAWSAARHDHRRQRHRGDAGLPPRLLGQLRGQGLLATAHPRQARSGATAIAVARRSSQPHRPGLPPPGHLPEPSCLARFR